MLTLRELWNFLGNMLSSIKDFCTAIIEFFQYEITIGDFSTTPLELLFSGAITTLLIFVVVRFLA